MRGRRRTILYRHVHPIEAVGIEVVTQGPTADFCDGAVNDDDVAAVKEAGYSGSEIIARRAAVGITVALQSDIDSPPPA